MMSQRTTEEYLETIGALEERESPVSTSSIAQSMGLSLASVSEMLRRLSEKGLVYYTPYGGTNLTEEGRTRFLRLVRRHRLWEVFLNRYLGIGWEDVNPHACNLEHATSDLVAEKLAEFLGDPKVCPHGSPIPGSNLKSPRNTGTTLADLKVGQSARILSVIIERQPEFLHYLTGLGLTPGATVKILEKAPYDGTLTIEANDTAKAIGREAASLILVKSL
jgi:DtxR family Mn-dependent transcriptional regulator